MINTVDNVKTSIFYINDFHGKSLSMEHVVSASNDFDLKYKNQPDVDTLKLSSGDIMLGEDFKTNEIAIKFQKMIGITNCAVGNHEFDMQDKVKNVLPQIKFNLLSSNIKPKVNSIWENRIKTSVIEEKNGHKYGIVGASPVDLFERSKKGVIEKEIDLCDKETTFNQIQNEVDKLVKKGINKIILLSHLGYEIDKEAAQKLQNVDVILGGHSHDLVFDVKEGENLFYNKNGEPVVITQAGRDGRNFGILNLEFDKNGVIKKVQNNIGYSADFHTNLVAKDIFNKIFGDKEVFGKINSAPAIVNNMLTGTNPHAYFICDCMKNELDSDIAILPSANIRGHFEQGNVDARLLSNILPFRNKLYKVKYSEKEIVEALKTGAQSFTNVSNKPGILYVSGLKYTMTNSGKLRKLTFIDKSGSNIPININNPRDDKFYTVIINDYCAQGNDGFTMLNHPDRILQRYPFDATYCISESLKKSKEPINIIDDGRIEIIS